jgi:hypothetical protein
MATVDMRHVNFWLPPDFRPDTQRTASQKHHRGSAAAATSQNQAVPLYNKAGSKLQNSSKFKSKSAVVNNRHGFTTRPRDRIEAQGTCRTACPGIAHLIYSRYCSSRYHNSVGYSDDDTLLPLEEALQNMKWRRNVDDSLQRLNNLGFGRSRSFRTTLRLENSNDGS